VKQWLVVYGLRLLASTWRIQLRGALPKPPSVIAFWHGAMLPVWYVLRKHQTVALCSTSRDGDLLAALLDAWKFDVVRGSSSRGGSHALESIIFALHTQRLVAITPDGPRGPALQAKAGAFVAAARSAAPVVPVTVEFAAALTLRSWDAFRIPLPFSSIVVTVHAPMLVASDSRSDVNNAMAAFTTTAR